MPGGPSFIRWFGDFGLADVRLVGGRNASLGEFYRESYDQLLDERISDERDARV